MNTNYKLLDSGDNQKLELFDNIKIVRPALQANYPKALGKKVWENPDFYFENDNWHFKKNIEFYTFFDDIRFTLSMGNNGQIGIFPEQYPNWQWLKKINKNKSFKIINGFAYTGGATLFASNEKNEICHLDSSKPAINKAKINAKLSNKEKNNIRWINEDVLTFLKKEVKRNNKYNGFIFDPPAFGRGKKGEIWKLKKDLPTLIQLIEDLSKSDLQFILISAHDKDFPLYKLEKMVKNIKNVNASEVEKGNLIINAQSGNHLKSGYYVRWHKR